MADTEPRPTVEESSGGGGPDAPATGGGASREPPGPDGLPLLGSTLGLVRDSLGFVESLADHGDLVGYDVAGLSFCAVLHPEYVEAVLVRDPESYRRWTADEWHVLADVASEGVLLTEGEQWRRQRRLLQPAFTPERIESYAGAMVDAADRTVDGFADGETVALDREASRLTLDVLATALFDVDVGDRGDVVTRAARRLNERGDPGFSTFLPDWLPTPSGYRFRRAIDEFEALVEDLVAERRRADDPGEDLLSAMLDATGEDGATLSETEVRDQLVTFLFAGHETTALALTYAFVLLGRNPEKRERLHDELDAVLGGDPPTPADLPDLDYTERVVREALRLYPPAYVLFRETTRDVGLGGYALPEGTKLTLPAFHVHRDGRFYDDPEAFRPGRWTDGFEAELPDYAYFPFGGGPRHCVGMRFALLELRLVLATMAQRVAFEPAFDGDPDLQPGLTLRPDGDVEMRVRER